MSCYYPVKGWRSQNVNPATGRRPIVFNLKEGFADMPIEVPCGRCIGCRLDKSREWAIRCMHEASLHEDNMFLTLTYSDQYLPEGSTLNPKHFTDFMKRYRKHVDPIKIRFFHCGEYGKNDPENPKHRETYLASNLGRPHYHAIIFGHDFKDKVLYSERGGHQLYYSPTLEKLWPFGFNTIGSVTFESAAYVARYVTKKIGGEMAENHYMRLDPSTGEYFKLKPEYTTMSRRPGIGKDWFDKFKGDCYPKDFITHKGKQIKIPKFYDSILEKEDIELYEKIKRKRRIKAEDNKDDTERLIAKEKVKKRQFKLLKRTLDNE